MSKLPYLPEGRTILYVGEENTFLQMAKEAAEELSLDPEHPTGAVVVKNGIMLGQGANGSTYHQEHGCERKKQGIPTGQQYELCPGCDPANHAERRAIEDVRAREGAHATELLSGADLYLWGHWWCCQWCWEAMIEANIRNVYLLSGAKEQFGQGS